jgi:hypothetical protein
LNEISAIDIKFKDSLLALDPRTWAHSQFPVKRFSKNTSNAAESKNSMLKKSVSLDITNFVISINKFFMAMFYERRSEVLTSHIFPKMISLLNDSIKERRRFSIIASNSNMYLVKNNITVDFLN